MVSPRRIFGWYRKAVPLQQIVGPKRFVAHNIFVTGSGSVGVGITLRGVEFETMSAESLDVVLARFKSAIRSLGPGFRVYQYLMRREGERISKYEYENPTVNNWTYSRVKFLEGECLSRVQLRMFVLYEPDAGGRIISFAKRLIVDRVARELNQELADAIDILRESVSGFMQAADILGMRIMSEAEVYGFLREYLNPDPATATAHKYSTEDDLDYVVADSEVSLQSKEFLEIDEYKLRSFVLKTLPSHTLPEDRDNIPFLLREVQSKIRTNLVICTEWAPVGTRQSIREARTKRRIRHGQTKSNKSLVNLDAEEDVDDLGEAQRQMRTSRSGKFSMSILFFDTDEAKLRRAVAAFRAIHWDGVFLEDKLPKMRFCTFASTIPGNASWNVRRQWLSPVNYADLSCLFRLSQGSEINTHLDRECLSIFETEDGTPHYFNLHQGQLAHTLMLGALRAGKSSLANQLIGDFQKYGGYTFILDIGGSYRAITEEFGGAYVTLSLEKWNLKINPFSLEPTPDNLHFLHQFVRALILNEGREISTEDDADLDMRIRSMYRVDSADRKLSWLNEVLPRGLKGSLHRWVNNGRYAAIFDNSEDALETRRFQTFDFTAMKEHPQAIGPLMFYFFHRIDRVVDDAKLLPVPKALFIDEGWAFILDWVVSALKNWPKNNAFVVFITQACADIDQGKFLRVLNEACPNKILLPNPGADVDEYGDILHLNSRERHLIGSMVRPQFLVKTPGESHVLRYRMEPNWKARYEQQREKREVGVGK